MKTINQILRNTLLLTSCLFFSFSLFSQDIQVSMCKNTSSELRLQNALGFGIRYNQTIFTSWKLGLGVNRSKSSNEFEDNSSRPIMSGIVKAHYTNTSVRFNIQKLLKNNDYVSISIGSALSYNMIKGSDTELNGMDSITHTQNVLFPHYNLNYFGIGFISEVEVKQLFMKQLSLCVTIEPEALFSKEYRMDGRSNVLPSSYGFTEFQVGLRYYLCSKKE